jgi:hypothetical protein
MSNLIAGTVPPKPAKRKEIVRITSSEARLYICLSASVWGQGVHWCGKRTEECLKDRKLDCPGCKRGLPWKWKGYLHVSDGVGWDGFLELTPTAMQLLQAQLPNATSLRGIMFKIRRTKGGARGRYVIEVLERMLMDGDIPEGADPLETLRFLWSCKRSYLNYDHV